jgi:hypothetical protein
MNPSDVCNDLQQRWTSAFFLSQSHFRNLKEHFRNRISATLSRNVGPKLHFRISATTIFSAVRNFNSTTFYIKFYINVAPQPHISISTILIFVRCPKLVKGILLSNCISAFLQSTAQGNLALQMFLLYLRIEPGPSS